MICISHIAVRKYLSVELNSLRIPADFELFMVIPDCIWLLRICMIIHLELLMTVICHFYLVDTIRVSIEQEQIISVQSLPDIVGKSIKSIWDQRTIKFRDLPILVCKLDGPGANIQLKVIDMIFKAYGDRVQNIF